MIRRVSLSLAGLLVALALAEWLLAGPLRPEPTPFDAAWRARTLRLHTALYQADVELSYVPRPYSSVTMDYGLAHHNHQGLREDREVPLQPSTHRIAMLGDSLVWGELVSREQSLPGALQRALGPGTEVIDFGVSGYDTVQEAAWYHRKVRAFSPDTLVLVFCLNDMLTMSGPLKIHGSDADLAELAAERAWLDAAAPLRNETVNRLWFDERRGSGSQVLAALRHALRWHRLFTMPGGYIDEMLLSARDPRRVARMSGALHHLGDELHTDGVQAVLVISPALYWWHDYQWTELHTLVAREGAAAGFTVLDPPARLAGEGPQRLALPRRQPPLQRRRKPALRSLAQSRAATGAASRRKLRNDATTRPLKPRAWADKNAAPPH